MPADRPPRIGYVLKMYPRFSETFVVSEILAREAAGEEIVILSLRPPVDPRFHPELARVRAPVIPVGRATSPRRLWATVAAATADPALAGGLRDALDELGSADVDDADQALQVAMLVREHGIDHLHAHFASVATTVARLAGRVAGVPYSFTAHAKDLFHEDVRTEDLRRKLRDAHHAVTISAYNRRHLQDRCGEQATRRLHLVRNGLELDRFPPAPPREEREELHLLGVGRLVEKKGFAFLVDAVAALRARGVPVRARIIGDGPVRADLEARVRASGTEDVVRIEGPRTQDEVRAAMADADLLVAPFVVGGDGNADGLPTVLLEAMATGLPCVAGDVTAVGEVVRDGETGWLVPSGDAAALEAAIADAARDPARRAAVATRARALVERHHCSTAQAERLRELVRQGDPA